MIAAGAMRQHQRWSFTMGFVVKVNSVNAPEWHVQPSSIAFVLRPKL
jgi:hypothetical protein